MVHHSLQYAIPVILLLVLLEAGFDRHHDGGNYRFNNALANLCAGMITIVVSASSHLVLLVAYTWVYDHARWVTLAPGWLEIGLAFFAYELMYYWKHRLGHEVNVIWGGHRIHHQSEDMNLSTGARLSATMPIWTIPFTWPLALLGISPPIFLGVQFVSHVYQFFLHSERRRRLPAWVSYVFNTPSHHRVHHGTQAAYLDKNYGAILILYDRLFGTFAAETERPTFGTLHPLRSWNPVRANFGYYGQLLRWVSQCRSGRDVWRVLFGRPDGVPAYLPDEPVFREKREAVLAGRWLGLYVLLQFLQALMVIYFLLRSYAQLSLGEVLLVSALCFWLLSVVGRLLDGPEQRLRWEEVLKQGALLGFGIWWSADLVSALAVGSLAAWFLFLRKQY